MSPDLIMRAVEILQQMGYRAEAEIGREIEGKFRNSIGSTAPATTVGYALGLALIEQNPKVGTIPSRAKDVLPTQTEEFGRSTSYF